MKIKINNDLNLDLSVYSRPYSYNGESRILREFVPSVDYIKKYTPDEWIAFDEFLHGEGGIFGAQAITRFYHRFPVLKGKRRRRFNTNAFKYGELRQYSRRLQSKTWVETIHKLIASSKSKDNTFNSLNLAIYQDPNIEYLWSEIFRNSAAVSQYFIETISEFNELELSTPRDELGTILKKFGKEKKKENEDYFGIAKILAEVNIIRGWDRFHAHIYKQICDSLTPEEQRWYLFMNTIQDHFIYRIASMESVIIDFICALGMWPLITSFIIHQYKSSGPLFSPGFLWLAFQRYLSFLPTWKILVREEERSREEMATQKKWGIKFASLSEPINEGIPLLLEDILTDHKTKKSDIWNPGKLTDFVYGCCDKDRDARIFMEYHTKDLTQQQIADNLGISQRAVSKILRKTQNKISAKVSDPEFDGILLFSPKYRAIYQNILEATTPAPMNYWEGKHLDKVRKKLIGKPSIKQL